MEISDFNSLAAYSPLYSWSTVGIASLITQGPPLKKGLKFKNSNPFLDLAALPKLKINILPS
jgi:hypothetical protein